MPGPRRSVAELIQELRRKASASASSPEGEPERHRRRDRGQGIPLLRRWARRCISAGGHGADRARRSRISRERQPQPGCERGLRDRPDRGICRDPVVHLPRGPRLRTGPAVHHRPAAEPAGSPRVLTIARGCVATIDGEACGFSWPRTVSSLMSSCGLFNSCGGGTHRMPGCRVASGGPHGRDD